MTGETDLEKLLKTMTPLLNDVEYVFCTLKDCPQIDAKQLLGTFKEAEGITVIIGKEVADKLGLTYSFVAAWITLQVHSSLNAVGLTAAVSKALTDDNISCNAIAAFYHDHIFVAHKDAAKAIEVLEALSFKYR